MVFSLIIIFFYNIGNRMETVEGREAPLTIDLGLSIRREVLKFHGKGVQKLKH
jgi:hypothetical protein